MHSRIACIELAMLGLVLSGGTGSVARAVNASPHAVRVEQPDGTAIVLRIRGNEFLNWYEDADGFLVVAQRAQGGKPQYFYAQPPGKEGKLTEVLPSDREVGKHRPPEGLERYLVPPRPSFRDSRERLTPEGAGGNQRERTAARTSSDGRGPIKVRNLVILMRFKDHKDSGRVLPTVADFQKIFNEEGGHPAHVRGGVKSGSVREFYRECSYNQFELQSTVVDWVDLDHTEAYYADGKSAGTEKIKEAIREALDKVQKRWASTPGSPRFKEFDEDKNGFIDAIAFVHSGYGAEWGGVDADRADFKDRIWSHRWTIPQWTSADGVKVRDYHVNPALWDVRGSEPGHIGVICHETGHFFGLPDLYDTSKRGEGAGSWCVMANSWGFDGTQLHPPHFSAWCKVKLGWVGPTIISSPGEYRVPRAETALAKIYKINQGFADSREYLLIENRQPVGYDRDIPSGLGGRGGLAIWHIDERKTANDNPGFPGGPGWPQSHYMVALLQADGLYELERGLSRGDGNDLWRLGHVGSLTPTTVPGTNAYVGSLQGVTIAGISATDETMTFLLSTQQAPTAPSIARVASAEFTWDPKNPKTIDSHATLLMSTVDLPEEMEVHIAASTSVRTAAAQGARLTTGFYNAEGPDHLMWPGSLRFVDAPGANKWVNVAPSYAVRMTKGRHTVYWKCWCNDAQLVFGSGTLTVSPFPGGASGVPLAAQTKGVGPETSEEQGKAAELSGGEAPAKPSAGGPGVGPPLTNARKKIALLVGIDRYRNFSGLKGCVNDVKDMEELLINDFHFKGADVLVLTDEKATYAAILNAFKFHILGKLGDNDQDAHVVIHFSSHGSQVVDLSGDESDRLDETIVTHDSEFDGKHDIIDDQIYGFTTLLAQKTKNITLILDCCHSGDAAKGLGLPRTAGRVGRAPLENPEFAMNPPKGVEDLYDGRRYVLISGCLASEQSYEIMPRESYHRGALTYHLARYLRESRGTALSYRSVMGQVGPRVTNENHYQHPQLEGDNLDQEVFGVEKLKAAPFVAAFVEPDGRVRLEAGAVHGMTSGSTFDLYANVVTTFNDRKAALAKLTLADVKAFVSFAKVDESRAPETLKGATTTTVFRAVERAHVYPHGKIPVLLDYPKGSTIPELLKNVRDEVSNDKDLEPHFRFVGPGERAWLVLGVEGHKITFSNPGSEKKVQPYQYFDTTKAGWKSELNEALFDWGRYHRIRQLKNEASTLDAYFEVQPASTAARPKPRGDLSFTVHDREKIQFRVTNKSDRVVYFYIFNLVENGTVGPLWPKFPGQQLTIKAGDSWPVGEPKTADVSVLPGKERNREGMLLLVTEQPIDTFPLLARGRKAAANDNPLTQLLSQTGLNDRPTAVADPGGWKTIYVEYEVVGREADEPGNGGARARSPDRHARQAEPELVAQTGHTGRVNAVALALKSDVILTGSGDGTVVLWDIRTGAQVRSFQANGYVRCLTFSPTKSVIVAGADSTGIVWELATGRTVCTLEGHSDRIQSVMFSNNGNRVLTLSDDGTAILWSVPEGRLVHRFGGDPIRRLYSAVLSPDGTKVLTGHANFEKSPDKARFRYRPGFPNLISEDKRISELLGDRGLGETGVAVLWDAETGKEIRSFVGHNRVVFALAFSERGNRIATGDGGGAVIIWDLEGNRLADLAVGGKRVHITGLSFDPRGDLLLARSSEKRVSLWDWKRRAKKRDFAVGAGPTDLQVLASQTVTSLTTPSLAAVTTQLLTVKLFQNADALPVSGVAGFSPDGRTVVWTNAGLVSSWSMAAGKEGWAVQAHDEPANSLAYGAAGNVIVVGSWDQTATVLNAVDGKVQWRLAASVDPIVAVAFRPDGFRTVSARTKNVLESHLTLTNWNWGPHSRSTATALTARHSNPVTVLFSPDRSKFLTGSWTGSAHLWDSDTGKLLQTFAAKSGRVVNSQNVFSALGGSPRLAWSPKGDQVAIADWGEVMVWQIAAGVRPVRLAPIAGLVGFVAFTSDGKYVFAESQYYNGRRNEKAFSLWEAKSGKRIKAVPDKVVDTMTLPVSDLFPQRKREAPKWSPVFDRFLQGQPDRDGRDTGIEILTGLGGKCALPLFPCCSGYGTTAFSSDNDYGPMAFSSDNLLILSGVHENAVLWNTKTRTAARTLSGHLSRITAVALDQEHMLTGSTDGTTRLWDKRSGAELARCIGLDRGGAWFVANGSRFDTDAKRELVGVRWVFPDDPFRPLAADVFRRDYYEPQLLPRLLVGEELPGVRQGVGQLVELNRVQPVVGSEGRLRVESLGGDRVRVHVRVKGNSGTFLRGGAEKIDVTGVYDLRLFRDNQLVGQEPGTAAEAALPLTTETEAQREEWRQKTRICGPGEGKEVIFEVRLPLHLAGQEVEFTAYAFNEDRVKSETAREGYKVPVGTRPARRRAYLVTVGVNAFESPDWNLKFACADALSTGRALQESLAAAGEFPQDDIIWVPLLSGCDGKTKAVTAKAATRKNIRTVLEALAGKLSGEEAAKALQDAPEEVRHETRKLRPATPDDLVLLFFSSHGYTDPDGAFYLLPYDIGAGRRKADTAEKDELRALLNHSVSSELLARWLRPIDAGQLALVIDACQSAGSVAPKGYKHGPFGSRGLGQLAYDKGMRVLAASAFDQLEFEPEKLGHGLLTYALVREGLEAGAAAGEGSLSLGAWLAFGERRCDELQRAILTGKAKVVGDRGLLNKQLELLGRPTVVQYTAEEERRLAGLRRPTLFDFARPGRDVRLAHVEIGEPGR